MRLRQALFLSLALVGVFASDTKASVTAPSAARGQWSRASILTKHSYGSAGGGHGWGPTAWEQAAVSLEIWGLPEPFQRDAEVVLAAESHPRELLLWKSKALALVKGPFKLRVSADGNLLALSLDGGASWTFALPSPLLYCPHHRIKASESEMWKQAPSPRALAMEVLRAKAARSDAHGWKDLPLHGTVSQQDAVEKELNRAVRWALLRAENDAELRGAALEAIFEAEFGRDEEKQELGATLIPWLGRNPQHLEAVKAILARRGAGAPRVLAFFSSVLFESGVSQVQALIAPVAEAAVAHYRPNGEASQAEEWGLRETLWSLARAANHHGQVDPATERAAQALLAKAQAHLRTLPRNPERAVLDPWEPLPTALGFAVRYAVVILGQARTASARETLAHLPCGRGYGDGAWPHSFPNRDGKDVHWDAEEAMAQVPQVSDWILAARRGGAPTRAKDRTP